MTAPPGARPAATGALRGRRVLIVEDEPLIAMELVDLLAAGDVETLGPAPTVRAALAVLEADRPDAVVLDLNLRGERSTPVARALLAAGVPFVLATGYARSHLDEPELAEAPLVPKPVDHDLLLDWLARLLDGR